MRVSAIFRLGPPNASTQQTHFPLTKTQFHLTLFNNLHCCFRNSYINNKYNNNRNNRRKVQAATTQSTLTGQQEEDTFSLSSHTYTRTTPDSFTHTSRHGEIRLLTSILPFPVTPFHLTPLTPSFGIMHCLISHLFPLHQGDPVSDWSCFILRSKQR